MAAHSYTWKVGAGAWNTASDWVDITASQNPSLTAPGAADTASIAGPATATTYIVSGPGSAAVLNLTNSVAFAGTIAAGSVSMSTFSDGAIDVLAGALLTANSIVATSQTLDVNGAGARIVDSGLFSVQGFTEVSVVNGGFFQAGTVAIGSGSIAVDPTGTFEVGTAGGAPAGTISVDAGTVVSAVANFYGPVRLNGLVNGNSAIFNGAVTGTGTVAIGQNAGQRFGGAVGAGVSVFFNGIGGLFTITTPASFAATVSGFTAADNIGVNVPGVTAITYAGGSLSLMAGAVNMGTIALAGSYVASQFLLLPFGGVFANVNITYATNAPTAPSNAQIGPNAHAYSWNTTSGGAWTTAGNWTDTTSNAVGAPPPGSLNAVTITSAIKGFQIINGNGNSASLSMTGQAALNGIFNTGALAMDATGTGAGSTIDLLPASVLNATSGALNGAMEVDGGTLAVSGLLAIGTSPTTVAGLDVYSHGVVTAGSLALGSAGTNFATIGIDATGTFEVGNLGGAAAGALTVDAGHTASLLGEVDGNIVDNGVITIGAAQFGEATVLNGALSGSGTVQVAAGGQLALEGNATGPGIVLGAGSTLSITLPATLTSVISGFAPGDIIANSDTEIAGVSYNAGTGALVLSNGAATPVGTLSLGGSFAGESFLALTGSDFGSPFSTVVVAAGTLQAGPPPSPGPGNAVGHQYQRLTTGGAWGTVNSWTDLTGGAHTATVAPGINDSVVIPDNTANPGAWQVLSGAGNSASTSVTGNVALSGNFNPGALSVTSTFTPTGTLVGKLQVVAGASVAAASVLDAGALLVDGNAAILTVAGGLTIGSLTGNGTLSAAGHASIRAAGLTSAATLFYQSDNIFVDATSTIEVGNAGGAIAGALNIDPGVTVPALNLTLAGNLVNAGTIAGGASANLTFGGNISGAGRILLQNGGFLTLSGTVAPSQTVALAATGSISLAATALPTITGFAAGNALIFDQDITGAVWSAGTLTLTTDGAAVESIALPGSYAGASFIATPVLFGNGVTTVARSTVVLASVGVACFAAGSRIATMDGDIAVEDLRAGDRVRSAFGGSAAVQWIGHRRLDCARHPEPAKVNPIRIRTGAFGPGLPARDLLLSPDHAVHLDGVLVPAGCLVDGVLVVQEPRRQVTYFHVELPQHDVILAEGLPCESYLDTGNRTDFADGGVAVALHPDFAQRAWAAGACAPQVRNGPKLRAIRAALARRSAAHLQALAMDGVRLTG